MKKLIITFLFGVVFVPFTLADEPQKAYIPMDQAVALGLEELRVLGKTITPEDRAFAEYWPRLETWFVGFERCVDKVEDGQSYASCRTTFVQVKPDGTVFYVPRH